MDASTSQGKTKVWRYLDHLSYIEREMCKLARDPPDMLWFTPRTKAEATMLTDSILLQTTVILNYIEVMNRRI